MQQKELASLIGAEWEQPEGFLGRLRMLEFDRDGAERLKALLRSIDLSQEQFVDKNLVTEIWFIVTFMYWQLDNFRANKLPSDDIDGLSKEIGRTIDIMFEVLGAP